MFAAAFLAGSFVPFSSEAVMTALVVVGLNEWLLLIYSTLGNTLGGMFNYSIGRLGKKDWIYHLLHVKDDKLERAKRVIDRYGAWAGLLSWLPILGSVITIAMGLLHIKWWKALVTIFIGKFLRYFVLALVLSFF
jgi:membrane protein YqaA with SNARE-associated domain